MYQLRILKDFCRDVGFSADFRVFQVRFNHVGGYPKILLLWKCYRIARDTDVFSEDVKEYLFNPMTYKQMMEWTGMSYYKAKNRVHRQVRNYFKELGGDYVAGVLTGDLSEGEAAVLVDHVESVMSGLGVAGNALETYFYEDFMSGVGVWDSQEELTIEEYEQARDRFAMLSRKRARHMLGVTDNRWRDYIVHLLLTNDVFLTETQLERKHNLIKFMMIEDYYEGGDGSNEDNYSE